jgi:hypothetical protein
MLLALIFTMVLGQIPNAPVAKQSAPSASAGGAFELQGDKLGESVATFTAQHPKAECERSETRTTCYQWADVAIFGLTAHAGAGCNLKKRYAADCLQGVTAKFTNERLVSLVYTIAGTDKSEAAAELRKKLGTPTLESRTASTWNSGGESASVVVGKMTEESDSPSLITISISTAN